MRAAEASGRVWTARSTADGPIAAWGDYHIEASKRLYAHLLLIEWSDVPTGATAIPKDPPIGPLAAAGMGPPGRTLTDKKLTTPLIAIQYSRLPTTGWAPFSAMRTISPMGNDFHIEKLADEFGQYILYLKCESCLHERRTTPNMLANLCGWDAKLIDVARWLRCSVCVQKKCTARAVPVTPPRGYKSH